MNITEKSFEIAKDIYAGHGVDVGYAMEQLENIPLCIHAWQGDDVVGFENTNHALTGGCHVTGNYPGRARTATELRADLDIALKLIPGHHKIGLQAHQVDHMLPGVDRDAFTIDNFCGWLDWAKEKKIGLDLAPAFYSHPKLDHGFSLSHPDAGIRKFWIEHGKACRQIGAEFGRVLGTPCVCNFWVPDGFKDTPANRYLPRRRLLEALDECFSEEISPSLEQDAVESKLFGIGTESCTIGSNEFYLLYATRHNKIICLDSGHFHPTESISDKISAILCMAEKILLHVSRGVRWDSDHVLVINDELLAIARESVAYNFHERIHFSLDYFDASINRIAAWVIGARNLQKALLIALLEPRNKIMEFKNNWDFSSRLATQEEAKTMPWNAVWNYFCIQHSCPPGLEFMDEIRTYEKNIANTRN